MRQRELCVRGGEVGGERNSALEHRPRLGARFGGEAPRALARLQKQIVRLHVLGPAMAKARLLVRAQFHLQGGDDLVGDLVLDREDVV